MNDKTEDYRADWRDIRQGRKPLAVFEYTGSREHWQTVRIADDSGQYPQLMFWYHDLRDDRRRETRAVAVADSLATLRQYQVLLEAQPRIPRAVFQRKLGQLFGYSDEDIAEFIGSDISDNCPCTLCGRDDTEAEATSRRTQYHA